MNTLSPSLLLSLLLGILALAVVQVQAANYYNDDDAYSGSGSGNADDDYVDLSGEDFDSASLMPVSCVNYMNGHMIKFQMYEDTNNFQCRSGNMGTFVVSISHYMRAYFNYQSLVQGSDFKLPSDAGYLNCVMLQQTAYNDEKLYAKIGCLERETYTSTKLRIHVYTDKQCSTSYDDGQTDDQRSRKGWYINGSYFNPKVSFRPPFYTCASCKPSSIASGFTKQGTYWYDDDRAASGGQIWKYFDDWIDDYFLQDDAYFVVQEYVGNERLYDDFTDDDFYTVDDDGRRSRNMRALPMEKEAEAQVEQEEFVAEGGALEDFEAQFWMENEKIRDLEDGYYLADDSVKSWNMCNKVYKYGVWCDEDCRSLDTFRIDEWSSSDVFLLVAMCGFMGSMMMLIFAKRVKAYEKAAIYQDDEDGPAQGVPPIVLALCFVVVFTGIIILANLRLVNETLVFAVVVCILLFIYMLKLTLFEAETPALMDKKSNYRGSSYYMY